LYFHVCERAGFDWIKVTRPELMVDTPAVAKVEGENELERFFHRHVFRLHDQKGAVPRTTPPASVKKPAATLLDAVRDHVLGTGRPIAPETRVAIGLATSGSEAALIRHAIDAALMSLNHAELPVERSVWMLDNGVSSENAAPQDACIVR